MGMTRELNENFIRFSKRATNALFENEIKLKEWSQALLGDVIYADETLRRCSLFVRSWLNQFDENELDDITDENKVVELKEILEQIKMEKIKVQTANLEYNAIQRAKARDEMFNEQIACAINRLEPFEIKELPYTPSTGVSGLLCIADLHAGSTYEIHGLNDEIVNKYDFETMQIRLWYLLAQMRESDIVYDDLTIAIIGDFIEGILRESSLTKLREPVIDTVIKLSEFLATWIIAVREQIGVPINIVACGGNHDIARYLNSRPQFEGENFGKVIVEFLKLRLKDISDITIDNYTDCAIKNIHGINVMFEHGESDPVMTMNYFENLYNISIDEAYYGHLHRQESKNAGFTDVGDRMCYRIGSICGFDPFAKKLRKASRASAMFSSYSDNGHEWSKTYYLN